MELIQTTEYLEDIPMWGQINYQLYPLGMAIPTREVGEEEKQWKGMKGLMKEIQPEGLGEVMLQETLEGEMAEDTCPMVHSIEMKGITRLESNQILQVKGEGGMILICIPLQPMADIREIYYLQPPPHQKIDSLHIGVVRGQDLCVYRMFQKEKPYYLPKLEMHMESNEGSQLHSLLSLLPSQPLWMKPIQMPQIRQFQ